MSTETRLTAGEVIALVEAALAAPAGSSPLKARLDQARELQSHFRREPIGGKLVSVKKLFHWFTASAFDRQAKVVEALLDVVDDLVRRGDVPGPRAALAASGAEVSAIETVAAIAKVEGEGVPRRLLGSLGADVEMLLPERLLLYSLVFSLKPRRSLEIGTFRGGSATLICAALDDNDRGALVCVDPHPQVPPHVLERIAGRATVLAGGSPEVLPRAREAAGGPFDFALIDGDHTREGVERDVEGVLEHLADDAHLLFHDSHYFQVAEAIDEALERHPGELVDAGDLSSAQNPVVGEGALEDGRQVVWGGLRLLRYRRTNRTSS